MTWVAATQDNASCCEEHQKRRETRHQHRAWMLAKATNLLGSAILVPGQAHALSEELLHASAGVQL